MDFFSQNDFEDVHIETGERRPLPIGVRRREEEEKVKLEQGDVIEVETVKKIFEMKVAGYGYKVICSHLNELGVNLLSAGINVRGQGYGLVHASERL